MQLRQSQFRTPRVLTHTEGNTEASDLRKRARVWRSGGVHRPWHADKCAGSAFGRAERARRAKTMEGFHQKIHRGTREAPKAPVRREEMKLQRWDTDGEELPPLTRRTVGRILGSWSEQVGESRKLMGCLIKRSTQRRGQNRLERF